jgi:AAA ATPase domain
VRPWPFEGRVRELALIRAAVADPDVHAVLVRAPAGPGKTRLVREVLRDLGCRTEWVSGTRAASAIPFGALAHLLPEDLPPTEPVGLVRAVCARVAAFGGVVIGVDDAHLLDDASSTVIANLVTSRAAFIVLTARVGEPLTDSLTRLARVDESVVLALTPLSAEEIDRLIDHGTGGAIDAVGRRRLRAGAEGNPLALRECTDDGQRVGIERRNGRRVPRTARRRGTAAYRGVGRLRDQRHLPVTPMLPCRAGMGARTTR